MSTTRARTMRLIGNLLILASLGVVSWWVGTMLYGAWQQRSLSAGAPSSLAEQGARVVTHEGRRFDVAGWDREDAAYWRSLPEGGAFGRLVAAKMGVDRMIVKGTSRADLRKGPGWLVDTDLPFTTGNTAVSGHRSTWGAPFWSLDELGPGDTVDLYSPFRRYRYVVEWSRIVRPGRSALLASTDAPSLTLTACHPRHSAAYRIVVRCKLTEIRRLAGK